MTAFDSSNRAGVEIWFDGEGDEVYISSDFDEFGATRKLHYRDIPSIISDLLDAYALRGGNVPGVLECFAEERGL